MKKIMSILAVLCSLVLLGGCINMSQNSEVRTTLEKAFNTAQGNDLFEVGKQMLDTYAPNEESIYIVSSYASGTSTESTSKDVPWIHVVVKYEINKFELKARLLKTEIGESTPSTVIDLIYKGKGKYYTLDNKVYEPLQNGVTYFENKNKILFSDMKNLKLSKNAGGAYGGSFESSNLQILDNTFDKINTFFSTTGPQKNSKSDGGMSYWNNKANGEVKQDLRFSLTSSSIEKNITMTAYVALSVNGLREIE